MSGFPESRTWMVGGFLLLLGLGAGCGSDKTCATGGDCAAADGVESDLPSEAASGVTTGTAGATSKDEKASASNAPAADDSAQRAISEADIIQVQGDQLFTLSRVAGLAVIDVSHPEALQLLGRYRELPGEPFEMYLRGDTALVMFTGWREYAKLNSDDSQYVTTSKLLALDVSDPSKIAMIGSVDVPGSISDSRIVGDILYVIGHEDGFCWSCEQNMPRTTIVSLDVSDPHAVHQVAQLAYPDGDASWGARSVTVTTKRMYVAGAEYGSDMPTGSIIQVVDISDPKGALVEGAAVPAKGQIASRWQLDEYDGVLRVISQPPPTWNQSTSKSLAAPSVQTFKVVSSNLVEALAQIELTLPQQEALQSVRFDGPRAYAITVEQKDPLFTIDLSDPTQPRQAGRLVIPGSVYYMEPRGERVLGLGFDQGNPAGSINVSLFDVKDLTAPQLLSRVSFGGSWGSLPQDQNRIQKVFRVLDDAGMILVPFTGWGDTAVQRPDCNGSFAGGVQIVEFKNDTLSSRGVTPAKDDVRRALLQGDHLLSVSDQHVQAFDISNRDAPQLASQVALARNTFRAFQLDGGVVARFSQDDWTAQPSIDFVANDDASDANQSYGTLDLTGVASDDVCAKSLSINNAFVKGSELDVPYDSESYDSQGGGQQTSGILVIDASDPTHARLVSNTHWDNAESWSPNGGDRNYVPYIGAQPIVRTDNTLSVLESTRTYVDNKQQLHVRLRIIDLRKPDSVKIALLPLGTTDSYSGLIADGETLLTSHFNSNAKSSTRGRFYVDRFDVSNPSAPHKLTAVNVPGALLQYDRTSGHALTVEQSPVVVPDLTPDQCYGRFAYADFESNGACTGYRETLHLVALGDSSAHLEDSLQLDENQQLTAAGLGDGVLFATLGSAGDGAQGVAGDCFGPCGLPQVVKPTELLVLGGFDQGKLEVGHLQVTHSDDDSTGLWGSPPLAAAGKQALLLGQSDVVIVDASTASAPVLTRTVPLLGTAHDVDIRADSALLTLGSQGVQLLSLQ